MAAQRICSTCGHLGIPLSEARGSFALEVCLWLVGLIVWPLLIVALIHTLWRFFARRAACPKCGGHTLLPIDSPIGRTLVESTQGARDAHKQELRMKAQQRKAKAEAFGVTVRKLFKRDPK